jgi:hypothetical protein
MENEINNKIQLKRLKKSISPIAYFDEKKRRALEKLQLVISHSEFLSSQDQRRSSWLENAHLLSLSEMQKLKAAIIKKDLELKRKQFPAEKDPIDWGRVLKEIKLKDLDEEQPLDSPENQKRLSSAALILSIALAEIFNQVDPEDFWREKLKLKADPQSYTDLSPEQQQAFALVSKTLKSHEKEFRPDWEEFVDTAASSFLLAKEAESQLKKTANSYPKAKPTLKEAVNIQNLVTSLHE